MHEALARAAADELVQRLAQRDLAVGMRGLPASAEREIERGPRQVPVVADHVHDGHSERDLRELREDLDAILVELAQERARIRVGHVVQREADSGVEGAEHHRITVALDLLENAVRDRLLERGPGSEAIRDGGEQPLASGHLRGVGEPDQAPTRAWSSEEP